MESFSPEIQLCYTGKAFTFACELSSVLEYFYFKDLKAADEPILSLQRNVFCSKREEQNLKDHRVLELLYEEAKFNILTGWN